MKERSFSRPDGGAAGLTPEQVLASRRRYGANVLTRRKRKGFFRQFLANFGDPIIKILLAALAVNLIFLFRTSDWTESVGIAAAVLIATLVSTLSQYGSESAFLELQKASANARCRVKRADGIREIPVSELWWAISSCWKRGEKIPADGVLLSGKLSVDQSALNGESAETEKIPVFSGGEWDLSHKDQLFCGSIVSAGDGIMRVGRVGDKTFYGGLAGEMQEEPARKPVARQTGGVGGNAQSIGLSRRRPHRRRRSVQQFSHRQRNEFCRGLVGFLYLESLSAPASARADAGDRHRRGRGARGIAHDDRRGPFLQHAPHDQRQSDGAKTRGNRGVRRAEYSVHR